MLQITEENWGYCQYTKEELRAIVSCGASSSENLEYYMTVLDENDAEVFQASYPELTLAISAINDRFTAIWDFTDTTKPKKEGGCSTCVAH